MTSLSLVMIAAAFISAFVFGMLTTRRVQRNVPAALVARIQTQSGYVSAGIGVLLMLFAFTQSGTARFALAAAGVGLIISGVLALTGLNNAPEDDETTESDGETAGQDSRTGL